jgi:hypothetical protein
MMKGEGIVVERTLKRFLCVSLERWAGPLVGATVLPYRGVLDALRDGKYSEADRASRLPADPSSHRSSCPPRSAIATPPQRTRFMGAQRLTDEYRRRLTCGLQAMSA